MNHGFQQKLLTFLRQYGNEGCQKNRVSPRSNLILSKSLSQVVKPSKLITVNGNTSSGGAMALMREQSIHSPLVVHDNKLLGIMTDKDFLRKVASQGLDPSQINVSDIMTTKVISVTKNESIQHCMALMADNTFHDLPVCEDGVLIGMISWTDIMEHVLGDPA